MMSTNSGAGGLENLHASIQSSQGGRKTPTHHTALRQSLNMMGSGGTDGQPGQMRNLTASMTAAAATAGSPQIVDFEGGESIQ